jgi:hypothetical protein
MSRPQSSYCITDWFSVGRLFCTQRGARIIYEVFTNPTISRQNNEQLSPSRLRRYAELDSHRVGCAFLSSCMLCSSRASASMPRPSPNRMWHKMTRLPSSLGASRRMSMARLKLASHYASLSGLHNTSLSARSICPPLCNLRIQSAHKTKLPNRVRWPVTPYPCHSSMSGVLGVSLRNCERDAFHEVGRSPRHDSALTGLKS